MIGTCIVPVISGFSKKTLQMSDLNIERNNNKSNVVFSNNQLSSLGNPPDVEWFRQFGVDYVIESGYSVKQTSDQGYIVVGSNEVDIWLIKTDVNGIKEWDKTFGGSGEEVGFSVTQTNDNGYILTGYTSSYAVGGWDVWLIKTDDNGNLEWNKTFGGSGYEEGWEVLQTPDGGYIISGYTESYGSGNKDAWIIHTDSDGNEIWNHTFGGGSHDLAYSIYNTDDNGHIIVGETKSYGAGDWDAWLIKIDSDGDELWNKTFGSSGNDWGESVMQTTDGGYIIGGVTTSYGAGSYDFWLIKTDTEGSEDWNRTYGGANWDFCYSVQQTTDGGYILAGQTESYGAGMINLWIIKTYSNGIERWSTTFDGPLFTACFSIQQTADDGYVATGFTSGLDVFAGNIFLLKLKKDPLFNMKTCFMIGRINNTDVNDDVITFNAENVAYLQLLPFNFTKYNSSELIIISPRYLGLLTQNFIFGIFGKII